MILATYFQKVPQRNNRYKENKIRRKEKEKERRRGQKCSYKRPAQGILVVMEMYCIDAVVFAKLLLKETG